MLRYFFQKIWIVLIQKVSFIFLQFSNSSSSQFAMSYSFSIKILIPPIIGSNMNSRTNIEFNGTYAMTANYSCRLIIYLLNYYFSLTISFTYWATYFAWNSMFLRNERNSSLPNSTYNWLMPFLLSQISGIQYTTADKILLRMKNHQIQVN